MATIPVLPMTGTQLYTALAAINAEVAGSAPLTPLVNAQTGTSYTLLLADAGRIITRSNAAANTTTIPTNATAAFPLGTIINVLQTGAGASTVVGATGVTVNGVSAGSVAVAARYQGLALTKIATNEWVVSGGAA